MTFAHQSQLKQRLLPGCGMGVVVSSTGVRGMRLLNTLGITDPARGPSSV